MESWTKGLPAFLLNLFIGEDLKFRLMCLVPFLWLLNQMNQMLHKHTEASQITKVPLRSSASWC